MRILYFWIAISLSISLTGCFETISNMRADIHAMRNGTYDSEYVKKRDKKIEKRKQKAKEKRMIKEATSNMQKSFKNKNFNKAHEYALLLSKKDNPDAFYILGWLYKNGKVVQKDKEQSDFWFKESLYAYIKNALVYHDKKAFEAISKIYKNADGVKQNNYKSKLWKKLTYNEKWLNIYNEYYDDCELDSAIACNIISKLTYIGLGTKTDEIQAINYLRKACILDNGKSCEEYKILRKIYKEEDNIILPKIYKDNRQKKTSTSNTKQPTSNSSIIKPNAYGLNVHSNQYGQAIKLVPDYGNIRNEQLNIKQDAYGKDIHSDQYGRPVRAVPAY